MKPLTKHVLTACAAMAGIGLVLLGIGMGMGGRPGVMFNKDGIHSPYQQTEPFHIEKTKLDTFTSLNININSEAEIRILPSDDSNYYVEYLLNGESNKPICEIIDNTLHFSQDVPSSMAVFGLALETFDFAEPEPYLTLYLPKEAVIQDVDIYNDSGSLDISGMHFGTASIENYFGNVTLTNVTGETLELILDDGNLSVDTLTADSCSLRSDYGNVFFKNASLKDAEIKIEDGEVKLDNFITNTLKLLSKDGNVISKELSCKSADFTLEYGNLELDTKELENLNCQMEYGSVEFSLPESMNHYLFDIQLEYGNLTLPDTAPMELYHEEDGEVSYRTKTADDAKDNRISITNEDGDVTITEP